MTSPIEGTPLHESAFRLTCESGFGNGWNHYAHSMAWFENKLYVGTTMATMAFLKINRPVANFHPWPVDCPDNIYDIDRRAEIWEYTPETDTWVQAFRAPYVKGDVPAYVGYRGMTVYQGKSDPKPCLYVAATAPQKAGPPQLLRSEDARTFEPVPRPPWSESVRSFRSLKYFQGRVHTSPTSSAKALGRADDSIGGDCTIIATDDPRKGGWQAANEEGFGIPGNVTVFEMEVYDNHLYAGTVNVKTGFELWKTPGGSLPYKWTPVIQNGAGRGLMSEAMGSLCVFKGALYMGVGILNGGLHRALKIGPAAAELLRVWPDDRWEMLVGESRVMGDQLHYPLSGYAAGFDNLFNGYIWRMCVHDGHLYAGTLCWANMLPYLPIHSWPEDTLAMVRRWGFDNLTRRYGGFELWRSGDGLRWEPVTRSGFGNKYNWGVRNFASTKHGLFVGTVNPFGPTVAVQRDQQWRYVPNPRGGCEVWLGSTQATPPPRAGEAGWGLSQNAAAS